VSTRLPASAAKVALREVTAQTLAPALLQMRVPALVARAADSLLNCLDYLDCSLPSSRGDAPPRDRARPGLAPQRSAGRPLLQQPRELALEETLRELVALRLRLPANATHHALRSGVGLSTRSPLLEALLRRLVIMRLLLVRVARLPLALLLL